MTEVSSEPERLVRELIDILNEEDYTSLSDVLAESFVLVDPTVPEGEVHGLDGIESLIGEIHQGFPDFHIEILDLLADEEVVMIEARYTGTHEGTFQGLPPTGRAIGFQGVEKYEIGAGEIQRGRVYLNEQELKEELGLTFPEVVGQLPTLLVGKLQAGR
jgi:steroid delta-isomerase-like uncharacterized protein